MIDTVKIAIELQNVTFSNYKNFSVDEFYMEEVLTGRLVLNTRFTPNRVNDEQEKKQYGYLPIVSISKYPNTYGFLVVRFSAPTLLLNSNIHEIQEADFDRLANRLRDKLRYLNIHTDIESIKQAQVWEIHTCKNIDLTGYSDTNYVLSTLNKLPFGKKFNKADTTYYGLSSQCFDGSKFSLLCGKSKNKSYEICFYDKTREMNQSTAGAEVLNNYHPNKTDILRFEYRLYKAQSIKDKLEQCDLPVTLVFEDLFKQDVIQTLNRDVWYKVMAPALKTLPILARKRPNIWKAIAKLDTTPMKSMQDYCVYKVLSSEGFANVPAFITDSKTKVVARMQEKLNKINDAFESTQTQIQKTAQHIQTEILTGNPFV